MLHSTTPISLAPCLLISLVSPSPRLFRPRQPRSQYWIPRASSSSSSDNDDQDNINTNLPPNSSTSSSSILSGTSKNVAPWALMGRVMKEDSIRPLMNQDSIQQGLIRSAAARASNLELEDFESRLADLLIIMPFLQPRLVRMKPALLAALATDVVKTAERVIQLKNMLDDGANIESILSQRPSLVLNEDWPKIPLALASLRKYYDDVAIAEMASAEPILLVENVDSILRELERLVPSSVQMLDSPAMLRSNPNLASQVKGLRDLSLW